jgi:hypothetical protein
MNDNTQINETTDNTVSQETPETKINPGTIRKATTQSILKAASAASGMEFESVEALAAALARLSAQAQPQNNASAAQADTAQSKRLTTTDLHEQFVALRQDLNKKEQMLRERELDGEIRSAMGDRFDPDLVDYALTKVKNNIVWEDGTYAIVNSKGQIRYAEDGNPMSINHLVQEVAKSNPKLLKMATGASTGSGLRPREGMFGAEAEVMPDYITDPAGFNAWASRNGLGKGIGLKGVRASVSNSTAVKKIM